MQSRIHQTKRKTHISFWINCFKKNIGWNTTRILESRRYLWEWLKSVVYGRGHPHEFDPMKGSGVVKHSIVIFSSNYEMPIRLSAPCIPWGKWGIYTNAVNKIDLELSFGGGGTWYKCVALIVLFLFCRKASPKDALTFKISRY